MQVQELQCQLAQSQLGRYLAGAALPSETLKELRRHIGGCERCKNAIAQRRSELTGQIEATKRAVVSEPARSPSLRVPAWRKPALLCALLAALLSLMSLVAKDPTGLFGPRAAAPPNSEPAKEPQITPPAAPDVPIWKIPGSGPDGAIHFSLDAPAEPKQSRSSGATKTDRRSPVKRSQHSSAGSGTRRAAATRTEPRSAPKVTIYPPEDQQPDQSGA